MKELLGTRQTKSAFFFLLWMPLTFAYLYWSWTHQLVGFGGDNAMYVLMAQKYSPYAQPSSEVASFFAGHSQFPPLYPLLLALFNGGHNVLIAHLVTTSCLLLALPVLFIWTRKLNLPKPAGLLITIALALAPGTYTQTLFLHSENLYLLLTLLLFVLITSENPASRFRYGASMIAAAATLTRSAGLALTIAYLCYLLRNRDRGWVRHAAVAIIPLIAWNTYAYTLGSHYVTSVIPEDQSNIFGRLIARVTMQWSALQYGWLTNLSGSGSLSAYSIALGALCLTGSAARLFLWRIDGLYVGAYLLLLLLWPFPAEATRFMFVLLPILLVHGAWLAYTLVSRIRQPKYSLLAALTVPSIALIAALPDLALALQRFQIEIPGGLEEYRRDPSFVSGTTHDALSSAHRNQSLVAAITSLRNDVPKGGCVFAIKPSIVGFLSDRISKAPPSPALSEGQFRTALDDAGCRHFLLLNMAPPTFNARFYPLGRLKNRIRISRAYYLTDGSATFVVALIGELRKEIE